MELDIYGLKCDNPSCDYNDETIKFEDYSKYINHPCPECGEPLLTQADYDTTMQIVKMVESGTRKLELSNDAGLKVEDKQCKVSIELDGSGIPKLDVSEID